MKNVHSPASVKELSELCFSRCSSLGRVTFGKSPSLKLICVEAFSWASLIDIHIPDSVEEVCDKCFWHGQETISCYIWQIVIAAVYRP